MTKSVHRKLYAWLLACVALIPLFTLVSLPAQAADENIMPLYNNTASASSFASISDNGVITISNNLYGISGVTTKAVITTYIEKKVLGLFWSRVDIGNADKQWVDVTTNYRYAGEHSFQLSSKGTYRVTVTYIISGTGGTNDEIVCEVEAKY